MATWQERLRSFALVGGLASASTLGCGKTADTPKSDATPAVVSALGATVDANGNPKMDSPAAVVNYDQPFGDAVHTEVLEGQELPRDGTAGGKKSGLLRAQIEDLWPRIKLTGAGNKPIDYFFTVETAEGTIEIALRPELAPNHVRNILALAKVGFYDGLSFERSVSQEAEVEGQKSRLDLLIAGCPNGTGDEGFGHIGYFVRAEFQPDVKHTAGTVGFWHEQDFDSAGTRFYITLGPAPALDGKFTVIGNVSQGLDIVKRIAARPVKSADPASPDNERPILPTTIKKVSIHPEVMEK